MSEQTNTQAPDNAKRIRRNAALFSLFVVLPFLAIIALSFGNNPHQVPFVLQGKPAPDFELVGLDGETYSLESMRGKPVVVNFWASWCAPCQVEHEHLQSTSQYYGEQAHFIGIIYQDELPNVEKYLARRSNRFPQLLDPGSKTAIDFGVGGVPETFFINPAGEIVHKHNGAISGSQIRNLVDPLLKQAKQ